MRTHVLYAIVRWSHSWFGGFLLRRGLPPRSGGEETRRVKMHVTHTPRGDATAQRRRGGGFLRVPGTLYVKGLTQNQYAMNHPAGRIGKRLVLKVTDVMKPYGEARRLV